MAVTTLSAKSVVEEDPKDLAQYGLDPPQVTTKAILSDGSEKTFLLGNKTPADETYYFRVAGDPKVYSVWSFVNERYRYTISDLRDKALLPAINADEITYLRVRQRDTVIELKEKTAAESKFLQLGFGAYIMTKPYAYPVGTDAEKSDPFVKGPAGLSIGGFVDDAPRDLSRYGLSKPWAELLVRDKSNTLNLAFGADKDANDLYFMIVGKPSVYTMGKDLVSFLYTPPFELVGKFAFIPNIDQVDRIEIASRGKTHILTLVRTVKKAVKEGDTDETVTAYTADGKSVEESVFKSFYQEIIGLIAEGEIKRNAVGSPELTVRYFTNAGDLRENIILYIPYNTDFYAISVNGKQSFAISKSQVSAMLAAMDKFLAGDKPKS
jgi:hypothetical protein